MSIKISIKKQAERISKAYGSMDIDQQVAVQEIISMSVIKGLETGIKFVKDGENPSKIHDCHKATCIELKTGFKILN